MPVALIVDPEVHKRIRKAVQRARKRIRWAQPYVGPRGGQWEDPAHTQHWRGAQHPGPHASPAAALDLSEVDLNTDGVDDAEVPHLLHVVGIDQDDLALHNGRMVDVMVQRDAGTRETAIHVTLPRSSWEDRSKTWERPLALRITLNPDRTAYVESVHTHPPGTGYGARLASRMIARLRAAGYTRIDLIAVRAEPDEDDPVGMNGYYTWPRFGWEARLDPRVMTAPLPRLPAALAGARTLSDLMKTEEGRDWWREHGQSIPATFDLAPDSVSSRLHAKYLEEKGIALAKGGGLDTSAADEAALDRAWERLRLEDARGMAKAERHTTYQGLPIHIEHDRGDTRRGTSPDGTEWATTMSHPYGEVTGTLAIDGDPIDVFLGPNPHATHAYVVQSKLPGTSKLDECKVMLGWDTQEEAVAAFRRNYDRPGFFLDVTKWPMPAFIDLVHHHRDLQDGKLDDAALAKVQRRALAKARRNERTKLPGDVLKTFTRRGKTYTYWGPPGLPAPTLPIGLRLGNGAQAEEEAEARRVLGASATFADLAAHGVSLSGLTAAQLSDAKGRVYLHDGQLCVEITTAADWLVVWLFDFGDNADLPRVATLDECDIPEGRSGHGTRLFGRAAHSLRAAGFSAIEMVAAGSPNTSVNGYYTWARFGVDGELSPTMQRQCSARAGYPVTHVSDMMWDPALREWWRRNGRGFFGRFDLAPSSVASQVLDAYLSEKGVGLTKASRAPTIEDLTPEDEALLDRIWDRIRREWLRKGKRKDTLPGGKGDDLEVRDVDHEEFEAGLREEMEEHGTNRSVATEIVLDHLAENPRYYSEMRRTKTRARKRLAKARARIRKVIALWKARGKKLKPGERVTRADGAVWVGQLVGPPKRISKRRGRGQVWRTTYGDHVVEDDDHGVQVIHAPTGRVIHQGLNQAHAHDIAQAADRDATPKPKVPAAGHIYDRIWANYLALTRKLRMSGGVDYPGGFVDIADVQDAMSREGFSASEVEDALVHMNDARMVQLLPNENLKTLTERDHHAAIRLGERDRHLLMMEAAPDANRLRQTPRPDWRWKPLPASASAEAHVRHAYHRAAPFPNALVRTSEIRKFIPAEVPQAEIDAALRRLRYSGAALFDGDVMSLLKAADTFTLPEHPEARAALAVAMEKAYQHRAKPPKNPDGWEPPGGTHPKTWRKGTPDRKGKATSTAGEFKRAAARELVNALDRVTHPEARKQLERAFVGLGLEKLHERGERVTYDGRRHASPEELFPGDAAHVVHPGWAVTDDAGPVLIRKAEVRPHKTAAFHEQVVHAASQLRTPIGTSGRHFSERVAIAQVYDKMHADGTFAGSLDAFKRQLVEAAGARKLRLERLDLREGLANDLRERSHTRWGSDSVHFVWLPDEEAERRRQAERATGRS